MIKPYNIIIFKFYWKERSQDIALPQKQKIKWVEEQYDLEQK